MLTIQQLSRELSIGVDTLRIWERRYGFPRPTRDSRGHRRYPPAQLEELRTVKKLQLLGHRPSRIFGLQPQERLELLQEQPDEQPPEVELDRALILDGSLSRLESRLRDCLARRGIRELIYERLIPIIRILDTQWNNDSLTIAREHLISDIISDLLKEQLSIPHQHEPAASILFLTLSGERHKLGLLMSAAICHQAGARCLLIQEELPLSEVPRLAGETNSDGVALSFSSHYPSRQAKADLAELRKILDPRVKILAGGDALQKPLNLPGLILCNDLRKIEQLVRREFGSGKS